MKSSNRNMLMVLLLLPFSIFSVAAVHPSEIVIDIAGQGDFETLTDAINSLPMFCYERVVLYVKEGVYEEKIRIEQDNITLRGESRDKTIIRFSSPRPEWIETPDLIGPAVINLLGDDIVIENMTIENTQPRTDIHAFAIYGKGTRTIIQNCNVWSMGGDTVSLWNYKEGKYYHANCDFRGAVDFVCPRGWCYIEDSQFFCTRNTVAIWHAGGYSEDQKFVIRNSSFDGSDAFELGRHHYDAQFFLIECEFSDKVMEVPIYRVTYSDPSRNRPDNWGHRVYFYNSNNNGLEWPFNNLTDYEPETLADEINAAWTFGDLWNPKRTDKPTIISIIEGENSTMQIIFSENITIRGTPELKIGKTVLRYQQGSGSNQLIFHGSVPSGDSIDLCAFILNKGEILATTASCVERHF